MKKIIDLLNQNWKLFLIVINLLILAMASIWFWFWADIHLSWDSENAAMFNNLFTPITGIISVILFGYTLLLAIRQNSVIMSQSLKPNFEAMFKRLIDNTKKENRLPIHFGRAEQIKVESLINTIENIFNKLNANEEYLQDRRLSLTKQLTGSIIVDREYFEDVRFLHSLAFSVVHDYLDAFRFIEAVNTSELMAEDKRHFKSELRASFVGDYIRFIRIAKMNKEYYTCIMFRGFLIDFVSFIESGFERHYKDFSEELETI